MLQINIQNFGGRGARSGISDKGIPYEKEYTSVLKSGNIKFVKKNDGSASAPLETMTKGRVYVTLGSDGEPRYISYHDNENKRNKTIDIKRAHNGVVPHTHHGYNHNENDTAKGYANLTTEEKIMVDRVKKLWNNKKGDR